MKKVSQTKQFSRDVHRMRKRGKDLEKMQEIVKLLAEGTPLPANHRNHPLIGPWQSSRDCNIEADWILIYTADKDSLRLERTGTHSDLFKK
ncbi:MAG: type II toxin-antitoxin system mRNA interferase toxin, RelE/StbE family [Syntrophobacterales bacterium CG23_combo_of_CG06-09_8_20_14_all_48_27]|nr:MAG: type II toxin-antitoxin system mRNA interferase toxin, RelE/StbE family [Syntrophobacterales bacterium CG23_combo_of_CG06-09_8_20_14_all_48_27]